MKKLIVEIRRINLDDLFFEIEEKGILKRMQAKVFKRVYRERLNALVKIIRSKLKNWIVVDTDELISSEEEGEDSYIMREKAKLDNFFNGSEKQIKGNPEYQKFKSDRIVLKVLSMRQRLSKAKDTAISLALGSSTIMDFFSKVGINVVVRVE